jgi:hypothetical protein
MYLSRSRRITSAIAALIASAVLVGCGDASVNPPLARTDGVAPVAPESVKQDDAPKSKTAMPRGSSKIGRDPSGVNRGR